MNLSIFCNKDILTPKDITFFNAVTFSGNNTLIEVGSYCRHCWRSLSSSPTIRGSQKPWAYLYCCGGESFLIEKNRFGFRNSSGHLTNGCSSPDTSESLSALNKVQDFFLPFTWSFWTQWWLKFSSVPMLSFSGIGSFQRTFDGFLAYKLRLPWSRRIL